jgi:hypothetical protein
MKSQIAADKAAGDQEQRTTHHFVYPFCHCPTPVILKRGGWSVNRLGFLKARRVSEGTSIPGTLPR